MDPRALGSQKSCVGVALTSKASIAMRYGLPREESSGAEDNGVGAFWRLCPARFGKTLLNCV